MSEAAHMPFALTPPPGEDELPYSDGEPVDSETHRKQQGLLTHALELAWSDRTDFYVGGNMFVYYSHLQAKKNDFRGPDVFVVLGTVRRVRKSWVVWEESGRTPDVVIEILSPTTEDTDRGEKMRIYAQLLHVPYYYLFDPATGVLEGYLLDTSIRGYVAMSPAPNGDLECPVLGLRLGVRHGSYEGVETDWLRWLDADGEPLPSAEEQARAATEQARASAEQARAAAEQARAAAEQARAAAEQARAAEQRAEEQATLREGAERRLAEALAELEQLRSSRVGG